MVGPPYKYAYSTIERCVLARARTRTHGELLQTDRAGRVAAGRTARRVCTQWLPDSQCVRIEPLPQLRSSVCAPPCVSPKSRPTRGQRSRSRARARARSFVCVCISSVCIDVDNGGGVHHQNIRRTSQPAACATDSTSSETRQRTYRTCSEAHTHTARDLHMEMYSVRFRE